MPGRRYASLLPLGFASVLPSTFFTPFPFNFASLFPLTWISPLPLALTSSVFPLFASLSALTSLLSLCGSKYAILTSAKPQLSKASSDLRFSPKTVVLTPRRLPLLYFPGITLCTATLLSHMATLPTSHFQRTSSSSAA